MKYFLSLLLLLFTLHANEENATLESDVALLFEDNTTLSYEENLSVLPEIVEVVHQNSIYASYAEIPKQVFKDEIFSVTYKVIPALNNTTDIEYKFPKLHGVKVLNNIPIRSKEKHAYLDTFNFIAYTKYARFPDVNITLLGFNSEVIASKLLQAEKLKVITLNPPQGFSNVLADSFTLIDYKTNKFDRKSNITVFTASSKRGSLKKFALKESMKEGFEALSDEYTESNMTYFTIQSKEIEEIEFSYFNLKTKQFESIIIPIILDDDKVSTQSDIKPKEKTHVYIKSIFASVVIFIFLVVFILHRRYYYFIPIVLSIVYLIYIFLPEKAVCIKAQSDVYLLPMKSGTLFDKIDVQQNFDIQGRTDGFIKININNKIGWVKNENICTH